MYTQHSKASERVLLGRYWNNDLPNYRQGVGKLPIHLLLACLGETFISIEKELLLIFAFHPV